MTDFRTSSGSYVTVEKKGHRYLENGLAVLGGALVAAYVLGVEVLPHAVYALGKCAVTPQTAHGIPWGVIVSAGVLILPKLVSRATYGRIWDTVADKLGRKSA